MPTPGLQTSRRHDANAEYYYRREPGVRELLAAAGVAIGAGLFAFYITRLLLQRTPLRVHRGPRLVAAGTSGGATARNRARLGHPAA